MNNFQCFIHIILTLKLCYIIKWIRLSLKVDKSKSVAYLNDVRANF